MTVRTALRLGRVSNLPTVWTNVLAGALLSGAAFGGVELGVLLVCLSLFYVGGMYLNDAFDHEIDARERPDRPIPSGAVSAHVVFGAGFAMLGLGAAGLLALGMARETAIPARLAALGLAALIVLYDVHHKGSRTAPVIMGLCRGGVYVAVAASLAGALSSTVLWAALALVAYVIGLTAIAAQETLRRVRSGWPLALVLTPTVLASTAGDLSPGVWAVLAAHLAWTALALRHVIAGRVPGGVVRLIAGICWIDALLVLALVGPAAPGLQWVVLAAIAGVLLTRLLQSRVPGT